MRRRWAAYRWHHRGVMQRLFSIPFAGRLSCVRRRWLDDTCHPTHELMRELQTRAVFRNQCGVHGHLLTITSRLRAVNRFRQYEEPSGTGLDTCSTGEYCGDACHPPRSRIVVGVSTIRTECQASLNILTQRPSGMSAPRQKSASCNAVPHGSDSYPMGRAS